MFDHDEVLNESIEDGFPVGSSFAGTPCLNRETADFIDFALAQNNPDCSVVALEKVEKQIAFLGSIQARLADHLASLHGNSGGTAAGQAERGTAHEVALARRRSQRTSQAYLRRIRRMIESMPYLFSRFEAGHLNETMVMAIMGPLDECSTQELRLFDDQYREHPGMFQSASTTQARDMAQKAVDEMHGDEREAQMEKKAKHRGVSFRSGRDCMHMNTCLPIEVGVALETWLEAEAQRAKKAGDLRSIAQLKADILVARLTGNSHDKALPIKLHVNLVMTDMALFLDSKDPASICGYGSVPGKYAARLMDLYEEVDESTTDAEIDDMRRRLKVFPAIRRLYTVPGGQDLVAMDSKERLFKGLLRKFLELRDPYCRTPYCTNKPRHADHVKQKRRGGATSSNNGCMKCEPCNLAKEAPGWTEEVIQESPHRISVNPGGSIDYDSYPPPLLGLARLEKLLDSHQKNRTPSLDDLPGTIIHKFPES